MNESPGQAFLRPGKVFLLVLLGAFVYVGAVITLVPAGWLWQQLQGRVSLPPEIQVQQFAGQLWNGVARLSVAGFPVRAEWDLGLPSLSALALPVDFSLATAGSTVQGDALVSWRGSGEVHAGGIIGVSEFEPLIRRSGGAVIEGDVTIERLNLAWADQTITEMNGSGRWGGGEVTWPMGNSRGRADFPPMRATLDSDADGVTLVVSAEGGEGPAAVADIRWTGMMDLQVFKRMVDLAQQPWSGTARADDVVFRVRQRLIPPGAVR